MRYVHVCFIRMLVCLAALAFAGCNMKQATEAQARQIVDQFYLAIKAGDFAGASKSLSEEFFQREPRESWIATMQKNASKLGALQEIKLKETQVNTIYSGRQFLYIFINRYEKGNATETMVLLQPVDKPAIEIVAYKVESILL